MGWVRWTVLVAAAALVFPLPWCLAGEPPSGDSVGEKKPARKPRVKVTISRETTYLTGPLRPDGYVDYVAAINARARQGVTPQNNAAVLFWQAFGPEEIDEDVRARFFELLGIAPLAEEGEYLIAPDKYLASRGAEATPAAPGETPAEQAKLIEQQRDAAMQRPWSKAEFPILAEWLEKNARPLALIAEGTRRPRCYSPMLAPGDPMVLSLLLPSAQRSREAARALRTRAMLRLRAGEVEAAWQDLLACHRLARLIGQGPFLIDMLVAIAIDAVACAGDAALAHHARLTAEQAKRFDNDWQGLPPMPKFADVMNQGERLYYLDALCTVARGGLAGLNDLTGANGDSDQTQRLVATLASELLIDWDVPLREGNLWYDRFVQAAGKPTRAERIAAMGQLDDDLKKMAAEVKDLKAMGRSLLAGTSPRQLVSQQVGKLFAALTLPALGAVAQAADRHQMTFDLTRAAVALAGYRADHGAYPEKLSQLSPKYSARVPKDLFAAGADPHYQAKDGGYVLYSVGINGKDDGGRGYGDHDEDTPAGADWDDLVIRAPSIEKTP